MTKLSYDEVRTLKVWERSTTREVLSTESVAISFVNLKNKAEGARRYGYTLTVRRFVNEDGAIVFNGDYQTTLNGHHYQSRKDTEYFTTSDEVTASLAKTVAGALKRYAKLATDPASKIEHRTL